jgi:hypothetical protein
MNKTKNTAVWREKWFGLIVLVSFMGLVAFGSLEWAEGKDTKKSTKIPPITAGIEPKIIHDEDMKMRENMLEISRQLGVTCNHCHDVNNLRSDKLTTFKVAKDHIRIVELLNKEGFRGNPKADCFMCHRGQAKPAYREDTSVH